MGNIFTSEIENPLKLLKGQLSKLGDRHPFGDDEILRLGRCHAHLRGNSSGRGSGSGNGNGMSFLSEWAKYCSTLPCANFKDPHPINPYRNILQIDPNTTTCTPSTPSTLASLTRRKYITELMKVLEEQILPSKFGDTLQRVAFTAPQHQQGQDQDQDHEQEMEMEMNELDAFLNGAAECSRRGSRKALEVMFNCCRASAATHYDASEAEARAEDLLNLAYRLGLASSLLTAAFALYDDATRHDIHNDQPDNSNSTTTPKDHQLDLHELLRFCKTSSFLPQDVGVKNLERSLLDYAAKMQTNNQYDSAATAAQPSFVATPTYATSTTSDNHHPKQTVSLQEFIQWSESTAPCLSACLETFLHYVLFPDRPYPPSRTEFVFPNLKGQHSAFFNSLPPPSALSSASANNSQEEVGTRSSPLLFALAAMSPSLGGSWHRLFTSDSDGLSFNRLLNALLGYSGPTLLILRESSQSNQPGGMFGAFTSTKWKEAKDFYGNSDCFLFRIQPSVAVYRPRSRGVDNYMYCNSESRSRGYDRQPHGIGFGGTVEKPRLFIAETLDGCMASSGDLTFEPGPLLPPPGQEGEPARKYFEVETCEVWGAGGDDIVSEALGARSKQREIVASNINKARKVDKAQFLDDFKSGLIESKAFQHRDQMRGRDDCQVDDDDTNNYVYAK